MAKIGGCGPFFEIRGGEDADFEGLSIGDYHYPMVFEPGDVGVTELGRGGWNDGVVGIFFECVATVDGVGDVLGLSLGSVESVDCNYTVGLIGEETRCIVYIDHRTSAINTFIFILGVECYLLVVPVIKIL